MDATKIHPALRAALASREGEVVVRGLEAAQAPRMGIIVRYRETVRSLEVNTASVMATGTGVMSVSHNFNLIPATAAQATPAQIDQLSERSDVEMVWLDEPVYAFLDTSAPRIEAPTIWATGNRGTGIKIAILDTGLDSNHPDFAGRIAAVTDFTGEGPADNNGHGTHVAGAAAGSGAASGGLYVGVAPEALILSAKVLRGSGTGRMSDVMAGVEWAVGQGAQVINLSLGTLGPCDGSDATSAICNEAMRRGIVVVVAAGNEGPGPRTVGSPGCATEVITVGASDDEDRVGSFSSRGPTSDGRTKPDVLFPGVHIVAARAAGTSMGRVINEHYASASGTSMATPHAAGACALLLRARPDLTPAAIKDLFMRGTVSLGLDPNIQGTGRVSLTRTLALLDGSAPLPTPTPPSPTPTPPLPTPTPTPPPPDQPEGCLPRAARALGRRS